MFNVEAPSDLTAEQQPPRYYWRGRSYDTFVNGQWYSTGTLREEYAPEVVNPFHEESEGKTPAHFVFNTGDSTFSLLYSPPDPIWVSRSGITFTQGDATTRDIIAWHAFPWLKAGETYQVDVLLKNPNLKQLREAGTQYPEWVTQKYTQLPQSFSPKIRQLAQDITANAETPYDKAAAITEYLRNNIEYAPTLPNPPRNKDKLEWFLFDYQKGFCVYYASSEVVMLRSLGIPARMAVGFAQGIRDGNSYTVRRLDAHAWPEVYFPGVGWVEFEPTASQPALSRPLPPPDPNEADTGIPLIRPPRNDGFAGREQEDPGITPVVPETKTVSPFLYVIPILLGAAGLIFLIDRRFPLATHVPVLVRASW
jgi:transglutaminase-like putative cysteine protease